MNKIKFLLSASLVCVAMVACNKDGNNGSGAEKALYPVSFKLSGTSSLTKADSDASTISGYGENDINSVIYNVYEGSATSGSPAYTFAPSASDMANGVYDVTDASLPEGSYTVQALINADNFTGSLADEVSAFSMFGEKSLTVTTQGASCNVQVSRNVARVRMVSLTDNSGLGFTYVGLALTNVVGECSIDGVPEDAISDTWYNKMGRNEDGDTKIGSWTGELPELLWRDLSSTFDGDELPMYCYPNSNINKEEGAPWSARATKIVLVVSLNGEYEYFPVTLKGGVENNHSYDVSLTIKGHGSDDPDSEPHNGTVDFTIDILPWVVDDTAIEETM